MFYRTPSKPKEKEVSLIFPIPWWGAKKQTLRKSCWKNDYVFHYIKKWKINIFKNKNDITNVSIWYTTNGNWVFLYNNNCNLHSCSDYEKGINKVIENIPYLYRESGRENLNTFFKERIFKAKKEIVEI